MPGPGRKPTVSDVDILREFALCPDPFMHATEVAEAIDLSRQGAHKRLDQLQEDGYLDSKMTGGTRNWWLTDEGRNYLSEES